MNERSDDKSARPTVAQLDFSFGDMPRPLPYQKMKLLAAGLERDLHKAKDHIDELYEALGYTQARAEQTGESPMDVIHDLKRDAPVSAASSNEEPVLPCDVTVGAGTFRKGVKVSLLQGAIDRFTERSGYCWLVEIGGPFYWSAESADFNRDPHKAVRFGQKTAQWVAARISNGGVLQAKAVEHHFAPSSERRTTGGDPAEPRADHDVAYDEAVAGYGEEVARMRAEGTYRDTVPLAAESHARRPVAEQEPVAWRYRARGNVPWCYANEAPVDLGPECIIEPMYGHPWSSSAKLTNEGGSNG